MIEQLITIARRFAGLDVQYRRSCSEWAAPWRVTLIASKGERAEYRIVRYGETLDIAATLVLMAVGCIDRDGRPVT